MEYEDGVKLRGELLFESFKDGKLVDQQTFHNDIQTGGYNELLTALAGNNVDIRLDTIQFVKGSPDGERTHTRLKNATGSAKVRLGPTVITSWPPRLVLSAIIPDDRNVIVREFAATEVGIFTRGSDVLFSRVEVPSGRNMIFATGQANKVTYTLYMI